MQADELKLTVLKIVEGDETAFKNLYFHFAEKLTAFSCSITRTQEVSDEIVDDFFLKIWQQKHQLVDVEHVKVYFYAAIRNASLNYLKSKEYRNKQKVLDIADTFDIDVSTTDQTPESIIIQKETFAELQAAIEQLPPRCRTIFKLIKQERLKYKEVAAIMNISVKTVEAQVLIAMRQLYKTLHRGRVR